jgi:hypothetical protein
VVDSKVDEFWSKRVVEDKSSKSSLAMMSVNQFQIGVYHPLWKTVRNSPKDVEKAAIQGRILTGDIHLTSK